MDVNDEDRRRRRAEFEQKGRTIVASIHELSARVWKNNALEWCYGVLHEEDYHQMATRGRFLQRLVHYLGRSAGAFYTKLHQASSRKSQEEFRAVRRCAEWEEEEHATALNELQTLQYICGLVEDTLFQFDPEVCAFH